MNKTINFKKHTWCLGRNGVIHMAGIHVFRTEVDLYLAPVTSRVKFGRAYMLIPVDRVPDVTKAMLRVSGIRQQVVVSVRGGIAETVSCPPGVTVKIIDHDNLEAEEEDKRRRAA